MGYDRFKDKTIQNWKLECKDNATSYDAPETQRCEVQRSATMDSQPSNFTSYTAADHPRRSSHSIAHSVRRSRIDRSNELRKALLQASVESEQLQAGHGDVESPQKRGSEADNTPTSVTSPTSPASVPTQTWRYLRWLAGRRVAWTGSCFSPSGKRLATSLDHVAEPTQRLPKKPSKCDALPETNDETLSHASDKTRRVLKPRRWEHSWLLVFRLPSAITEKEQSQFERILRSEGVSSVELVTNMFDKAFASKSDAEACVKQQMSSAPGTSQDSPDSFAKAQQVVIELTLMVLELISSSFPDLTHTEPEHAEPPLRITKFTTEAKDNFFVCMSLSVEAAEMLADMIQYPVQLSLEGVEKLKISLPDDRTSPAYVKYDHFLRDLCQRHPDPLDTSKETVLRRTDRVRILYDRLTDFVDLDQLECVGLLADKLPMHFSKPVHDLRERWGGLWFLFERPFEPQPLPDVRDYFGEEIAFYFLFLEELVRFSVPLSIISAGFQLWYYTGEALGCARALMSLTLVMWFRIFTKHWQRVEAEYANAWGTDAHRQSSIKVLQNVRFRGKVGQCAEDQNLRRPQVSFVRQVVGTAASFCITMLFILLLLLIVTKEHEFFFAMCVRHPSWLVHHILSVSLGTFTGLQIKVVDSVWDRISFRVTDLECNLSVVAYNLSKRTKSIAVRLITSVCSPFAFALASSFSKELGYTSVIDLLCTNLMSTLTSRYLLCGCILNDVVKPYLGVGMKRWVRHQKDPLSHPEKEAEMLTYESSDFTSDFLDTLLPLGLVIFFGMAAPWSVPLLLLLTLVQIRSNAWKLVNMYRRPYPMVCDGIGVFNTLILFWFPLLMINSNVFLLVFDFGSVFALMPADIQQQLHKSSRHVILLVMLLAFLIGTSVFYVLWQMVDIIISNESAFLELERRRQDWQRHHLLQNLGASEADLAKQRLVASEGGRHRDFREIPTATQLGHMRGTSSLSHLV